MDNLLLFAWDDVRQHRAKNSATEMNASEFKRIGNTFFLMNCDLSDVVLSILSIHHSKFALQAMFGVHFATKKVKINSVIIREANQNLQLQNFILQEYG